MSDNLVGAEHDPDIPDGITVTQIIPNSLLHPLQIQDRFNYRNTVRTDEHDAIENLFKYIALNLNGKLGISREAELAMGSLEEASMWAHKAIFMKPLPTEDETDGQA